MKVQEFQKDKIIAFAGNQYTTRDCMSRLIEAGYKISYLLNMVPEKSSTIAGYADLAAFAIEHDINLYRPRTYSLNNEEDQSNILRFKIDLLIVIGWQRLIPDWFLNSLSIGAFGMHGSSEPLPKGRGRSPMNWCLIEGKSCFLTHLFRYDRGVDSGNIVDAQWFDINPYDDIETLHLKNTIAQTRLLLKHLPDILTGKMVYTPQPKDIEPSYYPKRTPEDGIIHWGQNTYEIYNLIRAVTRPYPGAFSYLDVHKVMIWKAQPFDTKLTYSAYQPGTIVDIFYNNYFVVRTGDNSLLVKDYDMPEVLLLCKGKQFTNQPEGG